jgi:hypothetical protein
MRISMAVWRELYFTGRTFKADPAKPPAWKRGAYLVEGLGHCSSCHSPRNRMGAIEKDKSRQDAGLRHETSQLAGSIFIPESIIEDVEITRVPGGGHERRHWLYPRTPKPSCCLSAVLRAG